MFTLANAKLGGLASVALAALLVIGFAGCSGDDGAAGPAGPAGTAGTPGTPGPAGPPGPGLDPVASTKPESCATCHGGVGERLHQVTYDRYVDPSTLIMTFDSVVSTPTGATYSVALNFHITKNGLPYVDANTLPSMAQRTFYFARYNSATRTFPDSVSLNRNNIVSHGNGTYTLTTTGMTYAPEASNAVAYGYIAQDALDAATGGRVVLYDNMDSAALVFGNTGTYVSAANVEGCINCHGEPYRKHGYREAVVENLPDFVACKTCHFDTRAGTHPDWQQMVDDPLAWANGVAPGPAYDYVATVLNDTHMTHAMEFPYPMSMANCNTCHEGKLGQIFADANFTLTTCKSCHPVQTQAAYPTDPHRAPALTQLWTDAGVTFHNTGSNCQGCHTAAAGYVGSPFSAYHTGYNKQIYNAAGVKYSTLNSATITSVSRTGNVLDIRFTANNTAIVPTLTVSFYGWNTKDFLVSSHTRDGGTADCYNDRAANPLTAPRVGCRYEIGVDGNPVSTLETNRLFTVMADSAPGAWHVQADLSRYVQPTSTGLAGIPALITAGKINKAEIAVLPKLVVGGVTVALNAQSRTFDLGANGLVANYFQGTNALVDEAKCNACHDALATTFHSGYYGGKVTVCRTCHVPTSGGSHLEMQSRSIDSYVHAIHAFQAFDPGDVDFTDPVEAKRYGLHIEHTTPIFSLKACEACHLEGTFEVPDQSKSMPGLLSRSDTLNMVPARGIGTVPAYVTGPASKACGGCHRAFEINEDNAGYLASFNQHTNAGGYLVENDTANTYVYRIIDKMITWFQ